MVVSMFSFACEISGEGRCWAMASCAAATSSAPMSAKDHAEERLIVTLMIGGRKDETTVDGRVVQSIAKHSFHSHVRLRMRGVTRYFLLTYAMTWVCFA